MSFGSGKLKLLSSEKWEGKVKFGGELFDSSVDKITGSKAEEKREYLSCRTWNRFSAKNGKNQLIKSTLIIVYYFSLLNYVIV